jgi:hypothetical protein
MIRLLLEMKEAVKRYRQQGEGLSGYLGRRYSDRYDQTGEGRDVIETGGRT